MIISNLIGGLGNQMFQYATGLALSLKLEKPFKLDISGFRNYQLHNGFELKEIFNISGQIVKDGEIIRVLKWQAIPLIKKIIQYTKFSFLRNKRFIKEPHFHYWPNFSYINAPCYLYGHWQSEKYFLKYMTQIRNEFEFKIPLNGLNLELSKMINEGNSISIHIRRGDYITDKNNTSVFSECKIDYYESAINAMAEKIVNPHFFIFSNDFEWVKTELKISQPHTYIEHNKGVDSYIDMQLMSYCKHNIIANSSFSWWGAWLNRNDEKIIIKPKNWFCDNTNSKDLCPANWLSI